MSLLNVYYIIFKRRSIVYGFGCFYDKVGLFYMFIIVDEIE